jgi:hypothetical protein
MPLRRYVLVLALFALLAAQMLGVLHRVAHSPLTAHASAAHAQTHVHEPAGAGPVDALLELFTGHGSDSDCRVYDQIGHGDVLPSVVALVLPVVVPASVLQFFAGEFIARWAALFDARGPPSVR